MLSFSAQRTTRSSPHSVSEERRQRFMLDWMSRPVCVFLAAVALALPRTVRAVDIIGGPVTNAASGHIYYLLAESTWLEAEEEAGRLGGHLASINSQAEQDWIIQTFNSLGGNTNRNFLIGLNDRQTEGQFVWASGEPVTYTNWRPGEPNDAGGDEDCTEIILANADELGQWNDLRDAVFQQGGGQVTEHGVVEVLPRHEWIKWLASAGGNDHFYALTTTVYTNWFDAEAEASLFGGHLVSISSAEEQRFIEDTFLGATTASNVFYTGLNDLVGEGVYVWSSGESLTYTNWNSGEPNNVGDEDAVVINYHYKLGHGPRGSWNDTSAYGAWYRGIIEAPTVASVFTKVTAGDIVSDGSDLYTRSGTAWADINSDGHLDLFVSVYGGNNLLYRNNGDGTFTRIVEGNAANDFATSLSGVWGDYDNDGRLDLFITNLEENQPNALYQGDDTGVFTRQDVWPFNQDKQRSGSGAWADYDNDGYLDIFVCNNQIDQMNFLYRNRTDGTFGKVLDDVIVMEVTRSACASWSDYDNDGDPDLFASSEGEGPNRLYRNNGNGTFTKITSAPPAMEGGASAGCAWADYNNDGLSDLFVAKLYGEQNLLYQNTGHGTFGKILDGSVVADSCYSVGCAWGDYDNDGFVDLFVANWSGQDNCLYRNNGDGSFSKVTSGSVSNDGASSRGCAWGDCSNDGFLDLFVTNEVGEDNLFYRGNANGNRWLKLTLVGTLSNRSAIGAKVRLRALIKGKPLWQLREISGGTGYGSQDGLLAHFGLGDATSVDVLRIEWPSGMVQEFLDVRANQTLIIYEPPRLEIRVIQPFRSVEMILTSRGGFDYAIEATEDFRQWARIGTLTRVNGSVQFVDQSAGLHRQRFYRAAMVP